MEIKTFDFSKAGQEDVLQEPMGKDWPVVYLINNETSMYIGETSNIYNRFGQHLEGKKHNKLKKIHLILDEEFNKSAILDIEQVLIRLCNADSKFKILNNNAGQSSKHNYYQREKYLNKINNSDSSNGIWNQLIKLDLANNDYNNIINSDLFKYSPYTTLTQEQEKICYDIINDLLEGLEKKQNTTCVVKGSAGTGKTILGIFLMNLFVDYNKQNIDPFNDLENSETGLKNKTLHTLNMYIKKHKALKIAYVLPMASVRETIGKVFSKGKNNLKKDMVKGPTEIIKEKYDIIIVDEAHRLPKRKNISWMGAYDSACEKMGLDPKKTNTLEWILKQSKGQVMFYDEDQTVKGSDITKEEFKKAISVNIKKEYKLTTQMRCQGGGEYIDYLTKIFNCQNPTKEKINNYDIKVFDDVNEMISKIKSLDKIHGLCRNIAGFSWPWVSKNGSKGSKIYDMKFGNKSYVWNKSNKEWILSKNAVNEIGCVHTVQGYDLNYVGVIFGNEIDYDSINNQIVIYPKNFYDKNAKNKSSPEKLKKYIINAYKVMMSRGVKGCYVYACNKNLSNYLKKFLNNNED